MDANNGGMLMTELLYREEVFAITGAAMEVYNTLGPGFLEAVYQEALEIELIARRIPFVAQKELRIWYKDRYLNKLYIADVLCFDRVVVELKALDTLSSREESQLLNYLKATRFPVGLLLNFGSSPRLQWKRMAATRSFSQPRQRRS
jgi:GxxExxY protein